MSENSSTKILMAFLAGAAVGAAIGYFLNSAKKDELLDELKEGAGKLKRGVDDSLAKAKDLVNSLKNTDTETEPDIQPEV